MKLQMADGRFDRVASQELNDAALRLGIVKVIPHEVKPASLAEIQFAP
jgi:hypothetical protein